MYNSVNPILGLQAKYNEDDYKKFVTAKKYKGLNKNLIIGLSNLLYKIELTDREKKLLWKSFRKNKKMLESMNMKKKNFDFSIIETVCEALKFKR